MRNALHVLAAMAGLTASAFAGTSNGSANTNHVFLAQVLDDSFEASTWYRDYWIKDCNITHVQ
jgi:hypothetical protein